MACLRSLAEAFLVGLGVLSCSVSPSSYSASPKPAVEEGEIVAEQHAGGTGYSVVGSDMSFGIILPPYKVIVDDACLDRAVKEVNALFPGINFGFSRSPGGNGSSRVDYAVVYPASGLGVVGPDLVSEVLENCATPDF